MHVENHLAIEVGAQILLQSGAGLGLSFFDGKAVFVEVPNLVAHTELHANELVGVTVQESADSTGEVGVEHGVAVAGRGEQHLGGIQDAHLQKADFAPEFVAVHVVVLARKTDFFDLA